MDIFGVFRKADSVKSSMPDRLDATRRVTTPTAWFSVSFVGVVLLVAIIWGVFGGISIKVNGKGMILSSGGIAQITTAAQGPVKDMRVKLNDKVKTGDVVCRLDLRTISVDLETERHKLEGLKRDQLENDPIDRQNIVSGRQQEAVQVTRVEKLRGLEARGTVTPGERLKAEQSLNATRSQIQSREQAIEKRQRDIMESQGKIKELGEQLESGGEIRSPCDGRVTEISATVGDVLQSGAKVVRIEKEGDKIAVIFIPAADGKKVRKDYEGQVTLKKMEDWGYIKGKVQSVSSFPASPDRLKLVFGNEQLVKDYLKQSSSSMEVRIRLTKDPTTPSGVVWSTQPGPSQPIYSGTECDGNVTVEKKRPISYVLPIIRKTVGA